MFPYGQDELTDPMLAKFYGMPYAIPEGQWVNSLAPGRFQFNFIFSS